MTSKISFTCPSCRARIKAPAQLAGRRRDCPGCGFPLVVRPHAPEGGAPVAVAPPDAGPLLVPNSISDAETVEMLLEKAEPTPEEIQRLQKLEAENARLKRLLSELARDVKP